MVQRLHSLVPQNPPPIRPIVPGAGIPRGAARAVRLASPPQISHPSAMQRVFSGIQPSGIAHLGNYLGAIRNWVALQDSHECIYCVVDLHAITENWPAPGELERNTREMAAVLLACGIDPRKHILFNQSRVRAHAQLAWIFNCVARIGWLNRMTQFKDKAGKNRENVSTGLYVYPEPDGGRHPGLSRNRRARGRGPAPAPGARQRHRPEIQPRLRRRVLPRTSTR